MGDIRKTHKEFLEELKLKNSIAYEGLDFLEEYFMQTPNMHLNDSQGCHRCKVNKGEERVRQYLNDTGTYFVEQESFEGCKCKKNLSFDFYLPNQNICIEYDGIQHFKPIRFGGMSEEKADVCFKKGQKNDHIKNSYCFLNNIKLIRIPYTEYDNIEEILNVKQ